MSHASANGLKLRGCWTECIVMIPMINSYCEVVFQYSSALTHLLAGMPLRQDQRNLFSYYKP